jgi:[ribosomal protein S18]-alanine N-acetyltransferase
MPTLALVTLAQPSDAREIAEMSRDMIEGGLTWAWTPARVMQFIANKDSSAVVIRRGGQIAAFALMHFGDETAHLNLLAVAPDYRRQGLGRQLVEWLCASALEAGVLHINLELRATNMGAQTFYATLGFERHSVKQGYYQGRESALRMSRRLGRLT